MSSRLAVAESRQHVIERQRRTSRKRLIAGGKLLAVVLFLIWTLVPVLWLVVTAFKESIDVLTFPPKFFFSPTLDNFVRVFSRGDFQRWFGNSVIVATTTAAITILLGSMAAYGFSRYRFRGKSVAMGFTLLTRMIPPIVLVIPIFLLLKLVGVQGTLLSLILAHTTFNLPLVIWMMKTFFDEVPRELEEAAAIDGCNLFSTLWRVTIPITAPGIAATTVLAVIHSWNEYLFALVLAGGQQRTLPVGIAGFLGEMVLDFGALASAATVIMMPMLVLGFIVQRHLVQGMSLGAVKG